jgi:hypothetical protein
MIYQNYSTVIGNANGSLKYGYNNNIKNKKCIANKISVIVDINRIPYILKVTPSNPHVSKLINKQKNALAFFRLLNQK